MADAVTILPTSRYPETKVYDDQDGIGPIYGLWEIPEEFGEAADLSTFNRHLVQKNEVGTLDRVAVRHYGLGREALWWAIAIVNGIVNPETDMYAGQEIFVPPFSLVTAYMQRGTRAD